jgi:iron complex transport system substrate-binding protein
MKKILMLLVALPLMAQAVERVIPLGGDVTEIAWALGAGDTLVARDTTSTWPAEVMKLPNVGYVRQLNAEGILSLRPTLVLASAQVQPSQVLDRLRENHVNVVTVPGGYSLASIAKKVDVIADALGKKEQGAMLRKQLDDEIATLPKQPLNKRVLFILSHGGMGAMVAGQQTAADGAIRAAGLTNAMQGFENYRGLSQEGIIASQPDLVVISADGVKSMGGEENLWKLPGLAQTPAGRNKQVHIIDDIALSGFSVRTPQALRDLRTKAESLP